jgi:hypothetical protein
VRRWISEVAVQDQVLVRVPHRGEHVQEQRDARPGRN